MGECYMRRAKKRVIPFEFSYSGSHSAKDIMVGGVAYTLLTLTGSGTLSVNREIAADVWMCGGGGNGARASSTAAGGGGAGGYVRQGSVTLSGSTTATVASRGGNSSFSSLTANTGGAGSAT